jgi:flagellum-specific peptidoglycan hydrolase FlgJ
MLTLEQVKALQSTYHQAINSNCRWPGMAACEAMLESNWGTSDLAQAGNNLFGLKQAEHPEYGTISLPTREFLDEQWVTVTAHFVKYPDIASCFRARMDTLTRLAPAYPHYAAALAATNPIDYVTEVSKSWSTDPARAEKVIEIYRAHYALMT